MYSYFKHLEKYIFLECFIYVFKKNAKNYTHYTLDFREVACLLALRVVYSLVYSIHNHTLHFFRFCFYWKIPFKNAKKPNNKTRWIIKDPRITSYIGTVNKKDFLKEYRTYKRRNRYVESNFLYDKTEKLIEIDQQLRNTKVIVYAIRDAIVKLKGKEIGVKLSGKFKNQLLDILINEKCLSKVTAKTLDKHLNEIYSMSEDRFKAITSIKKTIIFD